MRGCRSLTGPPTRCLILRIGLGTDLSSKPYGKACTDILQAIKPSSVPYLYVGSTKEKDACRVQFGKAVNLVLDGLSKEEAAERVMVIDSDLEGSTGLKEIHKSHPEVFVSSGIVRSSVLLNLQSRKRC